jgi:hypothetical protein
VPEAEKHARVFFIHARGCFNHARGHSNHARGFFNHARGFFIRVRLYFNHARGHSNHARGFFFRACVFFVFPEKFHLPSFFIVNESGTVTAILDSRANFFRLFSTKKSMLYNIKLVVSD